MSEPAPTTRPVPELLRWRHAIAAALAVGLAPPLWLARNFLSDRAFYSQTQRARTEGAYQAYVKSGWLHVAEARRELVTLSFENAKRAKSVGALRSFLTRYPSSPYEADALREIHARYQEALERFRAQASSSNPRVSTFMTGLVAFLEARNLPGLLLRLEAPPSDALERADRLLAQSRLGRVAPIAPHFTIAGSAARGARIAQELGKGFAAVFPNDVLTLRPAGATKPGGEPEIGIRYEIRPSGTFYTSEAGGRYVLGPSEFVGINIVFRVRLEIPDGSEPLEFPLQVAPPEHFVVSYRSRVGDIAAGPSAGQVYETMADRAFDQLAEKLRSVFFAAGSEAFKKAAGGR